MKPVFAASVLIGVVFMFTGSVAAGSEQLDIKAELARPGVKLVALEFFATWCKPCMEAAPLWKELQRKYGPHGLRLIVVSAEGDGTCPTMPGVTSDVALCDTGGSIQRRFGVSKLPQAFLWAWQGDLLTERADAKSVASAVERFFSETQFRMTVDQVDVIGDKYAVSGNPAWIREYVVSRIVQRSKFDVVTSSDSHINHEKDVDCETTLTPNSVLRMVLSGDALGNRRLTLEIGKGGCVRAMAQRPYYGKGLDEDAESIRKAADLAVDDLFKTVVVFREPVSPAGVQASKTPTGDPFPYHRAALAEALTFASQARALSLAFREDPVMGNGCYPSSLDKLGFKPSTPPYYYDYAMVGDCSGCTIKAKAKTKDIKPPELSVRCTDGFINLGEGWTHPSDLSEKFRKIDEQILKDMQQ